MTPMSLGGNETSSHIFASNKGHMEASPAFGIAAFWGTANILPLLN